MPRRLIDIIATEDRKTPLAGTEETLLRDGASQVKCRMDDIADLAVARAGTVGGAIFSADTAADARSAINLTIGTNVQAYSTELSQVSTAVADAKIAGVDTNGGAVPDPGYLYMDQDGIVRVADIAQSGGVTTAEVNAAVAAAIAAYDVSLNPDRFATYAEIARDFAPLVPMGTAGTTILGKSVFRDIQRELVFHDEKSITFDTHLLTTSASPLVGATIGTGGNGAAVIESGHMGVLALRSGTAGGAGYRVSCDRFVFFSAGEKYLEVWAAFSTFTNVTSIIGFNTNATTTEGANGVHFYLSGSSTVTPKVSKASSVTSGTTATLSTDQWYKFIISVPSGGGSARFRIINWDTAASVLDTTITTTLPASTEEVGVTVSASHSSDTSGTLSLLRVDRIRAFLAME